MWTCPKCERVFKTPNQMHSCVNITIDDLFIDRPDHLVLAFDALLNAVMGWEPNHVGASKNTIVFTNKKAWLIVRPMKKELDIKFYHGEPIDDTIFKKITEYRSVYAHHIRIRDEQQLNEHIVELLRKGYDYAMK